MIVWWQDPRSERRLGFSHSRAEEKRRDNNAYCYGLDDGALQSARAGIDDDDDDEYDDEENKETGTESCCCHGRQLLDKRK